MYDRGMHVAHLAALTASLVACYQPASYPLPDNSILWGQGEPDFASGDCVMMQGKFKMADCNAVTSYYCQCDLYVNDPARY